MDTPVDVILSDTETRQPDILMVHRSRESGGRYRAIGAHSLCVVCGKRGVEGCVMGCAFHPHCQERMEICKVETGSAGKR